MNTRTNEERKLLNIFLRRYLYKIFIFAVFQNTDFSSVMSFIRAAHAENVDSVKKFLYTTQVYKWIKLTSETLGLTYLTTGTSLNVTCLQAIS
jgi:hypothetical protein